ncbi:DUF5681 domain-containing protein [Sphingomonas sp. RS2018]
MGRAVPPKQSRFKKGQSGNPKGRPKKQIAPLSVSAFDIVIERTLTVMQAGTAREMTVDEALEQRTYQSALGGNRMAQREVFKMIARYEKAKRQRHPTTTRAIEMLVEESDPRSADLALQIIGIAAINPARNDWKNPEDHLLLEPWAIQAALSRRSARRLRTNDIAEARRCTRDPDSIAWPEPTDQ